MTGHCSGIQPEHEQQAVAQRISADLRPSSLADTLLLRLLSDLLGIRLKLRSVPPVLCGCGSSDCMASMLPAESLLDLP